MALIAQLGERQTEDLKAPCSIHGQSSFLFSFCNADTRDRTRDLQIFSLTLSQLSYIGVEPGPATANGSPARFSAICRRK